MTETGIGYPHGAAETSAAEAKSAFLHTLMDAGFSKSYGSLLFLIALVGTDVEDLKPKTDEERYEWRGHLRGLRSALACLAIHDAGLDPDEAAAVVQQHIAEAASCCALAGASRR